MYLFQQIKFIISSPQKKYYEVIQAENGICYFKKATLLNISHLKKYQE